MSDMPRYTANSYLSYLFSSELTSKQILTASFLSFCHYHLLNNFYVVVLCCTIGLTRVEPKFIYSILLVYNN